MRATALLKRCLSAILCALTLACFLPTSAAVDQVLPYADRYENVRELPHKDTHTFSHSEENGTLDILDSHSVAFYAESSMLVNIFFEREYTAPAQTEEDGQSSEQKENASVSATVRTDTGREINYMFTTVDGNRYHLCFIPSYSGVYYLTLESRSNTAGDFSCEYSISQTKQPKANEIESYPLAASYKKGQVTQTNVSKVFGSNYYKDSETFLSVFKVEHEAGAIFSYTASVTDESSPTCVFYAYDGECYVSKRSDMSDASMSAGAYELSYAGTSYLYVYHNGTFSLWADMLEHQPYTVVELTLPLDANIDTGGAKPAYDEDAFNALIKKYPYSDLHNYNVIFFKIKHEKNSVLSFLYERIDHSYFKVVSDARGLSHSSVYPLRTFGEYCKESVPTVKCYESYVTDTQTTYVCYTGSRTTAYLSAKSEKAYTLHTQFDEKYKPREALPQISITGIYSDTDFYTDMKLTDSVSSIHKISGYTFESDKGEKYYFPVGSTLAAPEKKGNYTLYVVTDCIYTFSDSDIEDVHRSYQFSIAEFEVARSFSLPGIVTDIGNAMGIDSFPLALLVTILILVLVLGGISVVVLHIARIRKKKAAPSDTVTPPQKKARRKAARRPHDENGGEGI